jgi:hypothetical protein
VANDGDIVPHAWIAIEELVASAINENPDVKKEDCGDTECDAQGWQARLFNRRQRQEIVRVHGEKARDAAQDFHDAFGGFSDATEGRIASLSSEVRGSASTEQKQANRVGQMKEARVKPQVTIEYCTV